MSARPCRCLWPGVAGAGPAARPERLGRWTGEPGSRRYRALSLLSETTGSRMKQRLITSVSAVVKPERESELTCGFRELLDGTMPEGLLRTELLRGRVREAT